MVHKVNAVKQKENAANYYYYGENVENVHIYTYICEIMWYVDVDVYMFCDVWYEPLEPLESRNRLATWMT